MVLEQVWHEEKATVLMYQRHLQQQYVQAMKRNQQLEEALGLLGLTGVPSISPTSSSSSGSKNPPMSSPKSNCSDPIAIDLDVTSNSSGETHC
jgi:Fez1